MLTIFKYTIQYHQGHSQCCVTITAIYFQNFFKAQNGNSIIQWSHSPPPLAPDILYSAFSLYGFSYSGYLMKVELHNIFLL